MWSYSQERTEQRELMEQATALAATLMACLIVLVPTAYAQSDTQPIGDDSGPGQSVAQPAAQCPHTIACTYAEQNLIPTTYRLQSLEVCGANCTTQYWVSAMADGQSLLEVDPDCWLEQLPQRRKHYEKFGDQLPVELREQLDQLMARLQS